MIGTWICLFVSPAGAQALPEAAAPSEVDVAQAKELYRLGAGLYRVGRYEEAIGAFEEAYARSGNAKLWFNIANAQERLGKWGAAADSLEHYLAQVDPEDRAALELRVTSLRERAAVVVEVPPQLAPAVVPPPAAVESALVQTAPVVRRPRRWGLVGVGAATAVGFGAAAWWSFDQGQAHREAGDEDRYRTARTVNQVVVPLAGVGGALTLIGAAWPGRLANSGGSARVAAHASNP